jgi:hypothetical protein
MKYIQSPNADATMAGDRAAIYNRKTQSAITLNPTGTILWNSLTVPRDADQLTDSLRQRFPAVDPQQARSNVDAFLAELLTHELLQATD